MVISGTLHLINIESVGADDKAGAITIEMKDGAFEPGQLTVRTGELVRFVIKNRDLTVHTFTIKELGIDVKVFLAAST